MRLLVSYFLCSLTALFAMDLGHAGQITPNEPVWLVLSEGRRAGKLEIEPLGKVVGPKIVGVPADCDATNPEYKRFADTYLKPGRTYSVSFGGAPAGIVGLRGPDQDYGTESVEYDGVAHIHGLVMALATNANLQGPERSLRRGASTLERKLALQLASEKFAEAGLPAELLPRIQVENLTRTSLAPEKSDVLIGAFNLPLPGDSGIAHYLFFIAVERDGQLTPELVWTKISTTETGNEALRFVDQADLFGDGQEEVVAVLTYYEDYRYRVYRRTKDGTHWEQIFETEVLGCL